VDVRTVCNVEIEAFVQANLVAKTEEGRMDNAPIWTDLKTFPAREFRGKICGLIGGYPCQPFSSAGKRQGENDPRHLWPYLLKHVRAIRPVWCFWENVAGHTTMGLWRVLSDLEEEGYRVETGIFSAEEVGAPHQRKRVFILGYSERAGLPCGIMGQREEQLGGAGTWDGKELPNAKGKGLEGHSGLRTKQSGRHESTQDDLSKQELGNSTSKRPHRGSKNCEGEQSEVLGERLESDEWPARPREEQYEWEEPRVTEAQSKLGGATNGTQHRVDRLRLLGNGVVPQTAELAWKTLWKEINKYE
jgi:DNA (cytosine-5)-methyltransferase 1